MAWLQANILGLYKTQAPGNTWVVLSGGLGWRKLYASDEHVSQAMLTICTQAKSDGNMVYLWEPSPGVPITAVYSF